MTPKNGRAEINLPLRRFLTSPFNNLSGGGGWANPLQTLYQGLVLTFDVSRLTLSLTKSELIFIPI